MLNQPGLKLVAALVVFSICVSFVRADDFKLADGTEYKNVKVSRVEPDGIVTVTKTGIIKLFFADLPTNVQEKYHYDPKQAEAFRFRLNAARDAAAEQVAAEEERQQQEPNRETKIEQSPKLDPPQAAALSLEAHEIGTADGTHNRWFVDWDLYSRDFVRQKRLLITIRDFSRQIPGVIVHACFLGHPMGREEPVFVYGHAAIPVQLNRNLETSGTVDAPPLEGHTSRIGTYQRFHGSDIDGWIVVGEFNNRWFQVRASRQKLLDLAEKDSERLKQLVEEYESKHRHK